MANENDENGNNSDDEWQTLTEEITHIGLRKRTDDDINEQLREH